MEIKTKYCWVCGKHIPVNDFDKHYKEHYERKEIEVTVIPMKEEKPFNPIKGLDKL